MSRPVVSIVSDALKMAILAAAFILGISHVNVKRKSSTADIYWETLVGTALYFAHILGRRGSLYFGWQATIILLVLSYIFAVVIFFDIVVRVAVANYNAAHISYQIPSCFVWTHRMCKMGFVLIMCTSLILTLVFNKWVYSAMRHLSVALVLLGCLVIHAYSSYELLRKLSEAEIRHTTKEPSEKKLTVGVAPRKPSTQLPLYQMTNPRKEGSFMSQSPASVSTCAGTNQALASSKPTSPRRTSRTVSCARRILPRMVVEQRQAVVKIRILLMMWMVVGVPVIVFLVIVFVMTLMSTDSVSHVMDRLSRNNSATGELLEWGGTCAYVSYMYYAVPGLPNHIFGCSCGGNLSNNDNDEQHSSGAKSQMHTSKL
mmetsp:Transcript_12950/g.26454  ORF Transcript_12950/g.26454 Transcript_12950/m.26454 type:complete len:372 (-) Transcript_12950:13-1128(-)